MSEVYLLIVSSIRGCEVVLREKRRKKNGTIHARVKENP